MKKLFLSCLISLTTITCSVLPMQRGVPAANSQAGESGAGASGILTAVRLPVKTASPVQLSYVKLAEREKWILDEVLSDYISEAVVQLTEAGLDYTVGDWIDEEACTYLFLEKKLPKGALYTACGYAQANGGYVYFELSSSKPLTERQVSLEVERSFSGTQEFQRKIC